MSKKKVLMIGPLPPPIGGDTVSFQKLCKSEIFNEYFNVDILDTKPKSLRLQQNLLVDIMRFFIFMRSYIFKFYKNDLIFFNVNRGFVIQAYWVPLLLAKIFRKKVALKFFGGSMDAELNNMPILYRNYIYSILRMTNMVLPQTKKLYKWCAENGINAVKFPNWVSNNYLQYENIKSKKSFIFIGQIKKEKGVFNLINSMSLFPDVECHFFGPVLNKDDIEFFKEIKLSMNCIYHGILERDHLGDTIKNYKYLILPTFYPGEGVPAVLLESIAKGVPVITSRKGGITDIIDSGNGILFDTEKELTEAISIANNINIKNYTKMASAGVRTAESYTDTVVITDLCQRLNLLINS